MESIKEANQNWDSWQYEHEFDKNNVEHIMCIASALF